MKNIAYLLFAFIISSILFFACGNHTQPSSTEQKTDTTAMVNDTTKSDSSCNTETIMDPNDPKPMALMMRALVKNADDMRTRLKNGETLDSNQFPLIRFWLVEPTDPDVLEPQFFENARLFSETYKKLFLASSNTNQIKAYNAVIGKCINCHESYCSGPLKRIRKLPI